MITNEMYHWGGWSRKTLEYLRDSNAFLNISVGAIRSSKTISSLARWQMFLGETDNSKFAMIGVTMGALERNVVEPFMSMLELEGIPYDYKPAKQRLYVDDKTIALFGLDKANAEKKIQGYTSGGTFIDELTTIPQDSFEMTVSRNSDMGAMIFATCNPANPNHYVYQDYILQKEIKEGSVKVFNFNIEDNVNLTKEYIHHLKQLYPRDSLFYKRYILGQWVSGRGAIYDKFSDENIYKNLLPLSEYDYIEIGSDYGTSTTTCYEIIGIKEYPDHNRYDVIREYGYDAKIEGVTQTDAERVEDILHLQEEYGLGKENVFHVSHDATSLLSALQKDERIKMTLETFTPNTLECIQEISSLFYQNYLRIHEDCTETIKQVKGYEWDMKAAQNGIDKPMKKDDHYPDAIRAPIMNHLFEEEQVYSELVYL